MADQATYRLADGVLRAELDGEAVLLHPDTGVYHLLNDSGRTLLDELGQGRTLEEAVETLAGATNASPDQVRPDAREWVGAMLERRLLTPLAS